MFNEDELKFIKETAEKDLKSLDQRVEVTVNEMARLGKNLSDIKLVQSRLQSILQSIIDDETKKPTYNFATTSRCC
jgi:chaperonin cofactor prefoldin